MKIRRLWGPAALLGWAIAINGQPPAQDLTEEIHRLRKELTQVHDQRQKNRQELDNEKKDFKSYIERTSKRLAQARGDIDSVKATAKKFERRGDSLSAEIKAVQDRRRQVDLSKEALRTRLLASCTALEAEAGALPPMSQGQIRSAVSLVKAELTEKTVENAEAFNRLFQAGALMREATVSIQAGQENSLVPDLRGTVCRLRVGSVLELLADSKGEKGMLWRPGETTWLPLDHVALAPEIVKAVAIREGKALPAFVSLPFGAVEKEVKP